jgi:hypothetical protein
MSLRLLRRDQRIARVNPTLQRAAVSDGRP